MRHNKPPATRRAMLMTPKEATVPKINRYRPRVFTRPALKVKLPKAPVGRVRGDPERPFQGMTVVRPRPTRR